VEAAVSHHHIDIDGTSRRYRLYTPPALDDDDPMPLVLALHGAGNTPEDLVKATRLDQAASAGGFVVAYPEAQRLVWNGGFCCTLGRGDPGVDVRFLDRLIAEVSATRRIDPARVYAVGVSAGGIMAYRLACDLGGRIAGVGAVAAGMQLDDCRPSRPVSVLVIHGTVDEIVPYEGGRVLGGANRPVPPTPAVAEAWASMDGCPPAADPRVDGIVTTRTWDRCAAGTRVRLVTVEGGGHNWFEKDLGMPNGAVDATTSIAEFFGLA
jgi:polyhydroxybutyrate depolymerase